MCEQIRGQAVRVLSHPSGDAEMALLKVGCSERWSRQEAWKQKPVACSLGESGHRRKRVLGHSYSHRPSRGEGAKVTGRRARRRRTSAEGGASEPKGRRGDLEF